MVDEGANSEAYIKLFKGKENKLMKYEEILKSLEEPHAKTIGEFVKKSVAEALKAKDTESTKQSEVLKGKLEEAEKTVQELQSKIKETEPSQTEDEILKGLDPAVKAMFDNLKAQKSAAEEIAKSAAEAKETEVAVAKAKELKSLPVEQEKLVEVLKGVTPEVYDIMKNAAVAIEKGLLGEKGTSAENNPTDSKEAWDQIEKKAEVLAEEQQISKQKAIGVVVKQNPKLYKEYLAGGAN